ncbi:MAG: 5'-nucleotidase [Xanthomonadales bacterium]|nr:5'-nucleotidase [Xanthomonadales bacterium]
MTAEKPFVVAISSRALFDLDESHRIFETEGVDAYARYQIAREEDILSPGIAFNLVHKLLRLNQLSEYGQPVEVILLSRNSGDTGLRIFNSIERHGLDIVSAAFTNGENPYAYIESFGADLFLSAHAEDVVAALRAGYAAATILPSVSQSAYPDQLRVAFDGDAVLFTDEAERIYQEQGLDAFSDSEARAAGSPLPGGPFKSVLAAFHQIQSSFPADENPIRTALVTARSAPAHKRVILTLREWGIRIDEALFLGGKDKGPFLKAFGADIFFDDQTRHCESASGHVTTGHVPHGVTND